MFSTVLFDYDGVLVQSEQLHYRCWMQTMHQYRGYMDWNEYKKELSGQNDRIAATVLLDKAGMEITEQLIQKSIDAKTKAFKKSFLSEISIPDGISKWIIKNRYNLYLGVVSSSTSREVEPTLKKADILNHFDVLVFGDQVIHHKPNPEPYLKALERLNAQLSNLISAEQCVVIEDSKPGIAAAKSAGMFVIEVTTARDVLVALEATFHQKQL